MSSRMYQCRVQAYSSPRYASLDHRECVDGVDVGVCEALMTCGKLISTPTPVRTDWS